VGFPGETEEAFLDTYQMLNELEVAYLHVFTYSERPNTVAVEMAGAVPQNARRERSRLLRSLSMKKRRYFYHQHLGSARQALFESDDDNGWMYGFTDNYIKVKTTFDPQLANRLMPVQLETIDPDGKVRITLPDGEPESRVAAANFQPQTSN